MGDTLLDYLRREFDVRRSRNSRYSLRAFAKSIRLPSSTLSALLNQKRSFTPRLAKRLVPHLSVHPRVRRRLLADTVGLSSNAEVQPQYTTLDSDVFRIIRNWEHYAILSLLEITTADPREEAIAARLEIHIKSVRAALRRLEKVGVISRSGNKWKLTGRQFATSSDVPNEDQRRNNRQYIVLALRALNRDSVLERDITGTTMAICKERLPEAKRMITEFRRSLCQFLEEETRTSNEQKNAVYRLNVQLFPLDSKSKKPDRGLGL